MMFVWFSFFHKGAFYKYCSQSLLMYTLTVDWHKFKNLLFYLPPNIEKKSLENVLASQSNWTSQECFFTATEPQGNNSRLPGGEQQRLRPAGSPGTSFPPSRVFILTPRKSESAFPVLGLAHRCSKPATSHLDSQLVAVFGAVCGF